MTTLERARQPGHAPHTHRRAPGATDPGAPVLDSPVLGSPDLAAAVARAKDALLAMQSEGGYWVGELQGDSILESETILLQFILGHDTDPDLPLMANYLRSIQNERGGWSLFPGGPSDISGTVKAYFALKLLGDSVDAPHMRAAREEALRLGGAGAVNSFSKFYLAALGQVSFDQCPSIPPEIVYLPRWAYFNLHAVSAWTRTMILPLSFVVTHRPVRTLPSHLHIDELFLPGTREQTLASQMRFPPRGWKDIFLLADALLKRYDSCAAEPLRDAAFERAKAWLIERMDDSEGLGAIYPPMVYMLIVMRLWGYADDHPRVVKAHKELRDFYIYEGDTLRVQPCLSPVWDTGIAMHALAEAGLTASDPPAQIAAAWLRSKECRRAADWQANCPGVEPSGWFFEFSNPHYPDTDDTAMAILSLKRLGGDGAAPAIARGINWLLAMQNDDGGWAAFDRTRDRPILEKIPFADHNAMQDPSCPDITGRVLESLGHNGFTLAHPAVRRAVAFIRSRQEDEGCWFGRWGVNYIYGTWQVLAGLAAVREEMSLPYVQRAAQWLCRVQQADGSWGESCATYDDPSLKGQGESTPSQTAWGVMGLIAARGPNDPNAQRGAAWLVHRQRADGTWHEPQFTGTGFPKVFYLRYHLYRQYFPLMALGRMNRFARG
ncbi:MAG: squalene--hopene cyclase [Phycisphaeraceae bacterium]|nr:squalene--hopene cyclase [Phycisphaeraceae bacterium]